MLSRLTTSRSASTAADVHKRPHASAVPGDASGNTTQLLCDDLHESPSFLYAPLSVSPLCSWVDLTVLSSFQMASKAVAATVVSGPQKWAFTAGERS